MSRLVIRDLAAKVPVIQGGMGVGVSLSKLAGNVAKCGGIGIISTAQIGYQEEGFDEHPVETNLKAIEKHIKKRHQNIGRGQNTHEIQHSLTKQIHCGKGDTYSDKHIEKTVETEYRGASDIL